VADALERLARAPVEELDFATIDHHRALRQGYPEVIYCPGKTTEQIVAIAERIAERGDGFLATRASDAVRAAIGARFPAVQLNDLGRTAWLQPEAPAPRGTGEVLIVTAGTSDLPVAEEAATTAIALGNDVGRLTDVGVAGIHRLLSRAEVLHSARVVIVVAGMDGALPSVVAGLVRGPVIAVPTSVGWRELRRRGCPPRDAVELRCRADRREHRQRIRGRGRRIADHPRLTRRRSRIRRWTRRCCASAATCRAPTASSSPGAQRQPRLHGSSP
jgi:NCAIR mutase (PurE)-related proteins